MLRISLQKPLATQEFLSTDKPMKAIFLLLVGVGSIALTSCNTFIGLGRDMRIAGEGMENAANKATGGSSGTESYDGANAPVY
jgi:predicted small secreted protein